MSSVKPGLERTITIAVDPRSNQISQQDPRSKAIIFFRCLKMEDISGEVDYDSFWSKIQDLGSKIGGQTLKLVYFQRMLF